MKKSKKANKGAKETKKRVKKPAPARVASPEEKKGNLLESLCLVFPLCLC